MYLLPELVREVLEVNGIVPATPQHEDLLIAIVVGNPLVRTADDLREINNRLNQHTYDKLAGMSGNKASKILKGFVQ